MMTFGHASVLIMNRHAGTRISGAGSKLLGVLRRCPRNRRPPMAASSSSEKDDSDTASAESTGARLGLVASAMPQALQQWLASLRHRAQGKARRSLSRIPDPAVDWTSLNMSTSLDDSWDREENTKGCQAMYCIKQRQRQEEVLERMTECCVPLPCVRFDPGHGAFLKYVHRRLCIGRKGVGLIIARRRQGDGGASPPMGVCGFHAAPGRRIYFHEDLLGMVCQYKHAHNNKAFVLALHSTIGDSNSVHEYFTADARFDLAWQLSVTRLERALLLPDEELASLLIAVYVGVHARPALESYVHDNHLLNSEIVCHDGTYKFLRTLRQNKAPRIVPPTPSVSIDGSVAQTRAQLPDSTGKAAPAQRSAKRAKLTPGGQLQSMYTRDGATKNTNFQLTLSSDGRLLGFHAFAGETRYSQCCAHFEVLRQRCRAVLRTFGYPRTLMGVKTLLQRTQPFGALTDGFPTGGLTLSACMFALGVYGSFASPDTADADSGEHLLQLFHIVKNGNDDALRRQVVHVRTPSFVTAVWEGQHSPAVANMLMPLLRTDQWPPASVIVEPLYGLDWRHPVWTHRKEHLSKRHPLHQAFGNMYENLLMYLAAPPWEPDLEASCNMDSCVMWRIPDDVTHEIENMTSGRLMNRPALWFGKVSGWRHVWAMWEHNQLSVLVSFMHVLPQSLLVQTMYQVNKRFHRVHGDYMPRRSTQLVYADSHQQFFEDQLRAYERLARQAPARSASDRRPPRSDLDLSAGQQYPLLTEASAGFTSRLLTQYTRLVAARKIHYFVQRTYLRGRQSGTIRLENTAMLVSQKRPRKVTRRGLYTCQAQCILLFQQQFESDWAVVSSRRVKDGHLQVSHQPMNWDRDSIRRALDSLSNRQAMLGLNPIKLPLHVYFSMAKKFAAAKLQQDTGHRRSLNRNAVGLDRPVIHVSEDSIFASSHWCEFASSEELQYVAQTIDGNTVAPKQVQSCFAKARPQARPDLPRAVQVTFPAGTRAHVCVQKHRTLCGQPLYGGRLLRAAVGTALPTCARCITSNTPWLLPQNEAEQLAAAVSATATSSIAD